MSRDGYKNFTIRTCEHMILGQLTMGARKTKNGPLMVVMITVMMLMLMTVLTMMIAKGRKVG